MIRNPFKYDLGEPPVFVVLKQGWVSHFQLALNFLTGGGIVHAASLVRFLYYFL